MIAMPFDSLQFAKKLKAAKDPEAQAEVVAAAFRENFDEIREGFDERDKELADVKAKLQTLAADTKSNAEKMATKEDIIRLEGKITSLEVGLRKDMEALGNKLIIRLTLAMLGVLGVVGTIVGFVLRAALMK